MTSYRFGPRSPGDYVLLDGAAGELIYVGGEKRTKINLTAIQRQLLRLLLQHNGHNISFDEVLSKVWDGRHVEKQNINRNLTPIKKALAMDDRSPTYYIGCKDGYVRVRLPVVKLFDRGLTLDDILVSDTLPDGIRELTSESFLKGSKFQSNSAAFLQGDHPTPETAANASVENRHFERLRDSLLQERFVLLHGAMGEGKSTLALQLAKWFVEDSDRRVFVLSSATYLGNIGAVDEFSKSTLFIVDNAEEAMAGAPNLSSWLRRLDISNREDFAILFITRTPARRRFDKWFRKTSGFGLLATGMPQYGEEDASSFVDLIKHHKAALGTDDRSQLVKLFVDGLGRGKSGGGLWPAQYQATRGERLLDRVFRMVDDYLDDTDLSKTPSRRIELELFCAVIFINGNSVFSGPLPSTRPTAKKAYEVANFLCPGFVPKSAVTLPLAKMLERWRGELRTRSGTGSSFDSESAEIEFRHTALTHAFYRAVFGSTAHRARQIYRNKWAYYRPLLQASTSASAIATTIENMYKATLSDIYSNNEGIKSLVRDNQSGKKLVGDFVLEAATYGKRRIQSLRRYNSGKAITDARCKIDMQSAKTLVLKDRSRDLREKERQQEKNLATRRMTGAISNENTSSAYLVEAAKFSAYTMREVNGKNWRELISLAQKVDSRTTHKVYRNIECVYLGLAIEDVLQRESPAKMRRLIVDSGLLEAKYWDDYERRKKPSRRLWALLRLLPWANDLDLHALAVDDDGGVSSKLSTVNSRRSRHALYWLVWREMYRLVHKPNFDKSRLYHNPESDREFSRKLFDVFDSWNRDCEIFGEWPIEVSELIGDRRGSSNEYWRLASEYDQFDTGKLISDVIAKTIEE